MGFDTGIALPVGMVHVQPAVNRQPGYRWGDLDRWSRPGNPRFLKPEKSPQVGPGIGEYVQMGSAASASQATEV